MTKDELKQIQDLLQIHAEALNKVISRVDLLERELQVTQIHLQELLEKRR